ncbi:hypothetical protein K0040_01400 [Terrisporobacter petrolearius]|uniref:hypothetical protein n=1 Tax=Terrisporobacter petrolearius TaxID=1460447 RepID=UPI001D16ED4C|nr:hypothetical protein [Terrisporobacter petrolearius]MCC3862968.1 hypothetical protein [Terrisporobacter petrolearius]
MNNKMINFNQKNHSYLTNDYEDNFSNYEWNNDDIMMFDDYAPVNDDYENENSKRYSFPQKKGFIFKQNKYK